MKRCDEADESGESTRSSQMVYYRVVVWCLIEGVSSSVSTLKDGNHPQDVVQGLNIEIQ